MKQIKALITEAEPILRQYEALLKKWQKAVNLISSKTISEIWTRHILDSAQLYSYIPSEARVLVDMGSGAGFPALVLAVLNKVDNGPLTDIYLIESDTKKCVFLTEAARVLGVKVHILNCRLEETPAIKADVITARALATVDKLITYGKSFLTDKTIFLLLKGENVSAELAENKTPCQVKCYPSQTGGQGCVVYISEVKRND